jgi:hypothetical protein
MEEDEPYSADNEADQLVVEKKKLENEFRVIEKQLKKMEE